MQNLLDLKAAVPVSAVCFGILCDLYLCCSKTYVGL